jgi:hypothetical protein
MKIITRPFLITTVIFTTKGPLSQSKFSIKNFVIENLDKVSVVTEWWDDVYKTKAHGNKKVGKGKSVARKRNVTASHSAAGMASRSLVSCLSISCLTSIKAHCHYQSFPSKTLSKKTWTKCLLSLSMFFLSSLSLEGNLVNTHFIISLTFPRPYIFWNVHDSSTFCQIFRACLKACSEMPGYGKYLL